MVSIIRHAIILFLLMLSVNAIAATARVDRTIIQEGETFSLTVQADNGEPDLSPLDALFDVVSTSKSSQMSFINGRMSSRTEWNILLMPKHVGRLVIPALAVGNEKTAPIEVQVMQASAQSNSGNKAGQDVIIEAKAEPENPYVQAQVVYTVKLYYAVQIQDGGLSQPKIDNAVVEKLGDDARYQTQRNGRLYQVTERRYAIFPQQSGQVEIPATVFGANIVEQRGGYNFDPFNRFFAQPVTRPVRLRSATLRLQVRPKPMQFTGTNWLPSQQLQLSQTWSSDPTQFKVGEPITRTVRIEAVGLTAAQLPSLDAPSGSSLKAYPDQPSLETKSDGNNLLGVRIEKSAIVPTHAGNVTIAAVEVPWWNTKTDRMEIARLPAQVITVAATLASPTIAPDQLNENNDESAIQVESAVTTASPSPQAAGFWPWISGFFALAWLVTMVAWWRRAQPRKVTKRGATLNENPPLAQWAQTIKKAALANDAAATRHAIQQWAKARWPSMPGYTLHDVAQRLEPTHMPALFEQLDKNLYAPHVSSWDGRAFWDSISPHLNEPTKSKSAPSAGLPALYPH